MNLFVVYAQTERQIQTDKQTGVKNESHINPKLCIYYVYHTHIFMIYMRIFSKLASGKMVK